MEYYQLYIDAVDTIRQLEQFIEKLQSEVCYYRDACDFDGVPDTPLPHEVFTTTRER